MINSYNLKPLQTNLLTKKKKWFYLFFRLLHHLPGLVLCISLRILSFSSWSTYLSYSYEALREVENYHPLDIISAYFLT